MVAELTALRDQIDEVDKALLSLLAKRLELVAEVGEVKSQYGLPIYVPEREAAMLASRREEAAALGVPPDPIPAKTTKASKPCTRICGRWSSSAAAGRWGVCLRRC